MTTVRADRRLVAILAADVVGYSRLMERDEAGTLARLKAHRKNLLEPLITDHRGRIVKLMGDGALCEFGSVVDAAACAILIQRRMAEREAEVPEAERIRFRIGINLGDVIHEEDGDLYGDGVNITAPLQQLCDPGGVVLSGTACDHLQGKLDLPVEFAGERQVKNLERPVRLFRVVLDEKAARPVVRKAGALHRNRRRWQWLAAAMLSLVVVGPLSWYALQRAEDPAEASAAALPLPDEPSIAVLPFDNLSGDERIGRLADGLTEDIITGLARFSDLFVIARTSSFAYKGKPTDMRQIGRELGVHFLLEGSVQSGGDRLRITAQLINAATGAHVWSERWDRPAADLFSVQDELTQAIAGQLGGRAGVLAQTRIREAGQKATESLEAYELYLIGMEHKHQLDEDNVGKAREYAERAIALDPGLAKGHVLLAWTHFLDYDEGWSEDPPRSKRLWREAAERALAHNPLEAEGHYLLGLHDLYGNDYAAARAEFDRAVDVNPNNADVLALVGGMGLNWLGYSEAQEAAKLVERAARLNPFYPAWYENMLRAAYFVARRWEDTIAIVARKRMIRFGDHRAAAIALTELGRREEAERAREAALAMRPDYSLEREFSDSGMFPRDEDNRFLIEANREAGFRICMTEEEVARSPDAKRLPECEIERRRKNPRS